MPGNIPKGYYLADASNMLISHSYGRSLNIEKCPKGMYNDEIQESSFTVCKTCVAGKFGAVTGLLSSDCSGPCNAGLYCPAKSTKMELKCDAGHYGATGEHSTSTCQGPCPVGHWCAAGATAPTDQKCAVGYYGNADKQTSRTCVGPCPAGYHCPAGTVSPTTNPCTDPTKYCPEGSDIGAVSTPNGAFATPNGGPRYSGKQACPPGHFCAGGVKAQCPAGSYGSALGLQTTACSGLCGAGFFCT
jgi:hypothetical protein